MNYSMPQKGMETEEGLQEIEAMCDQLHKLFQIFLIREKSSSTHFLHR